MLVTQRKQPNPTNKPARFFWRRAQQHGSAWAANPRALEFMLSLQTPASQTLRRKKSSLFFSHTVLCAFLELMAEPGYLQLCQVISAKRKSRTNEANAAALVETGCG
jgi:hypothetical protein